MNQRPSTFSDAVTMKAIIENWPRRTWFSPKERVLFQAQRLKDAAARSNQSLVVVKTRKDITDDVESSVNKVYGLLAVEGLPSLEFDITNVDVFYNAGIRIL